MGRDFRSRIKKKTQNPPIASGAARYIQLNTIWRSAEMKFGSTIQYKSTIRTKMMNAHRGTMKAGCFFNLRESNNANGTANSNRIRKRPRLTQFPARRCKYQLASSGIFPDKIISHCENDR